MLHGLHRALCALDGYWSIYVSLERSHCRSGKWRHVLLHICKLGNLGAPDSGNVFSSRASDRLCGLLVWVSVYRTEMYFASCEVRTDFIHVMHKKVYRVCCLVVRVSGYRKEIYCASCKVWTDFIHVIYKYVYRFCGLVVRVPSYRTEFYCASWEVRTEFIYVM
jgi:hypothetical protein